MQCLESLGNLRGIVVESLKRRLRRFAITIPSMPAEARILLGSGLWFAARSKPREEPTFRVTYEVIFHDRSSRTHTYAYVQRGHTVYPIRLAAPVVLSPSSFVQSSDIQIATEHAKPALNGTRSSVVTLPKSYREIKICRGRDSTATTVEDDDLAVRGT